MSPTIYPMACPAPRAAIARFLDGPGSKWLEKIPIPGQIARDH